jgi:hypothetical protein
MANILATRSAEMRAKGDAMIQQADKLLSESWNERMWSDGEPINPSPTIDQAVNGGFSWLEIQCARCKTPSDVDLAAMKHPPTTFVHDLASRLHCRECANAGRRPAATCYNWPGSRAILEPKPEGCAISIMPTSGLCRPLAQNGLWRWRSLRWSRHNHSASRNARSLSFGRKRPGVGFRYMPVADGGREERAPSARATFFQERPLPD